MKSLCIVMHTRPDLAAELVNDRADVARRASVLARLWRYGSCQSWRPPILGKTWGDLAPVAVVCLFFDDHAEALLAARPEELRPLLRTLSPLCWQFVKAVDPANRPAPVALQGVTVGDVQRSDESYYRATLHARLFTAPLPYAEAN